VRGLVESWHAIAAVYSPRERDSDCHNRCNKSAVAHQFAIASSGQDGAIRGDLLGDDLRVAGHCVGNRPHAMGGRWGVKRNSPAWNDMICFGRAKGDILLYDNMGKYKVACHVFSRIHPRCP
jgi:hypothetical protein